MSGPNGPLIHDRAPERAVIERALVTPGMLRPGRLYAGEVYAPDGTLCPLSLRPSERAGFKHVPRPPQGQPRWLTGRRSGPSARLAGHHLFAGPLFGIFGHDLVELPGRLWPLLGERFDGIVVQKFRPGFDTFQLKVDQTIATILEAFGIGFHDVHVIEQPTTVERLTVPEPALRINDSALRILGDCFRHIAVRHRGPPVFAGRGFYLSRSRTGSARVANEPEVEAAARAAGLQVLHPQFCALPTQIALMGEAEILAGTDGSALHLAAFVRSGTRLLSFDTRSLVNQHIINALAGLDAHSVRVPPHGRVEDPAVHMARLLA